MFGAHPMFRIGGGAGYQIPYSLRFRSANSAYLSRSFGTPTSNIKWTWSGWIKRGALGSQLVFNGGDGSSNNFFSVQFTAGDLIQIAQISGGVYNLQMTTSAVFRDPSAWYHIVIVYDSANATSTDRVQIYINNSRQAVSYTTGPFGASTACQWNVNARTHYLRRLDYSAIYGDMYAAEENFIDGQDLTPSSFGYTAGSVWVPKKYSGTYGSNGFYLKFADATTTTTIGNDSSGNANNWTTSGISVTSGVTFDQMTDSPTTNFCVLNPLIPSAANISWANLRSGTTAVRGTINALLANSYWEVTAGGSAVTAGTISDAAATNTTTVTANKVFGFRLTSAGTLDYINITDAGSWTNIASGLTGQQFPYGTTAAADWNFGQRAFVGTVPSTYAAVSTAAAISAAITTSGSFTGNAAADGPVVWINGNPATLTINGNAVTFGTHADKTAGGFKLRTSSASYNAAGANTWTATAGSRFVQSRRPNNAQVNP
jgi:hypothetical protein